MLCLHELEMVLGQSAGLCKEVCLYAGADWLKLVSRSVAEMVA